MGICWDKISLSNTIWQITGIDLEYLRTSHVSCASISCRMSWVSNRVTSRIEDIAYCMLGNFDVHMPLLYGEGRRAFQRLQEELLKSSSDQSIFAWDWPLDAAELGHCPPSLRTEYLLGIGGRGTCYTPKAITELGLTGRQVACSLRILCSSSNLATS